MNSIKPSTLLTSGIFLFLAGCYHKPIDQDKASLEGSWNLVSYVPHPYAGDGTNWVEYGDSIIYQKHLSPDHFAWFSYDLKNNQILGMGGGSYVVRDGKYIENIKFFYPPGSSELGQAIPFSVEFRSGFWYHTGYAKQMAVDMETGKLTVIDSNKIEEKWVRSEIKGNPDTTLVGTWQLVSYRDRPDAAYTEYPEFVGYVKLLTPTHFTWIYYDMDGDEIYAAGSGEYTFDGQSYVEKLNMLHPDNLGQTGETIRFRTRIINNTRWEHFGYLPIVSIDESTGNIVRDSSLIDERWKLYEAEIMDGITF